MPLHPDFAHVETWVFDLDNTLYPPVCNLFAQVDERMCSFIERTLEVDRAEAKRLQKLYYVEHGTTLSGLMRVHGIEPGAFLDYVHEIDVSHIEPDPMLQARIERLPGRKVIFTNGSLGHAENVSRQLQIDHLFDHMFDIVAADFIPKPHEDAYKLFLEKSTTDPTRAAMFEDIARNLAVPHSMGMRTVWVRPGETGPERHQQLSHEGGDGEHVHHVTDDLTHFLGIVLGEED